MTNKSRFSVSVVTSVCIPMLLFSAAAQAEYRIQAGDVIEITMANADMRQRVPVQLDGTISVPLAGTIRVEGASISEVRSEVRTALASKLIRVRTPDGREISRAIEPDEVAAAVVEYKPIFITGDVLRPGSQDFRPRMTVRQAIVAAGGAVSSGRVGLGSSDIPDLQSQYVAAWTGVAADTVKLWRIGQEMGDNKPFDGTSLRPGPLSPGVLSQLVATEKEAQTNHAAEFNRDKDYYRAAIKEADHQIEVLTEQQRTEDEGAAADEKDLQRAMDMYGKGNLPSPRVSDYRRAVLLSSTRRLQTAAWLSQVKRTRADFERSLAKMDSDRQLRLLNEQQDVMVRLATERAKLQAADEKLRLAGARPPLAGEEFSKPQFVIIRRQGDQAERSSVDEDAELQPGDVLQVAIGQLQLEARQ